MKPLVIDLSHHNNVQDVGKPLGGFDKAKASGIIACIHKCTEGVNFVDPRYRPRMLAWKPALWGAYHFITQQNPAAQADYFLAHSGLTDADEAVVDWESEGVTPAQVRAFCERVEAKRGRSVIIYSGNTAKEKIRGKDAWFGAHRLWLAQYSSHWSVQESWTHPWLWQNNGDNHGPGPHTIPGIDGYCDNSTVVAPMTPERLKAEWGKPKAEDRPPAAPPPPPTPEKEPPMTTPPATAPAPVVVDRFKNIDFAQIEKYVESAAAVLPILATFVPQAKALMPFVPVLEGLLKMADELDHASDAQAVADIVAKHMQSIGEQVKQMKGALK